MDPRPHDLLPSIFVFGSRGQGKTQLVRELVGRYRFPTAWRHFDADLYSGPKGFDENLYRVPRVPTGTKVLVHEDKWTASWGFWEKPQIQTILFESRHLQILPIFILRYPNSLPTSVRCTPNEVFWFPDSQSTRLVWQSFASFIPTFEEFQALSQNLPAFAFLHIDIHNRRVKIYTKRPWTLWKQAFLRWRTHRLLCLQLTSVLSTLVLGYWEI